jgi:hypothetical protein
MGTGGRTEKTENQSMTGCIFVNLVYKIFLTFNATSWVVVIYGIKDEWTIAPLPTWVFGIGLLLAPIILSAVSIPLTLLLDKDNLENCGNLEEASNSFLPTYLGYFFVGLGIEKFQHLTFIYFIILLFTYVAQTQYYNPIFLLFGYCFYNAETAEGAKVFLIVKKNMRRTNDTKFSNLRRINDTTYIAWGEE